MKEKKVSVIMPVFNCENFLDRAISSVITQTHKNLELIIIDDGSTDASPKICDQYAKKDTRIRVLHKKNEGVSVARNIGLKMATGDYVQFLDSDDFLEPNATQTLVSAFTSEDIDLVACGYFKHNHKVYEFCFEKSATYNFKSNAKQLFSFVKEYLAVILWNKMFKRSLINFEFDKNAFIGEDTLFNLAYLANCRNVATIAKPLYHYDFTNQNSAMHTKVRNKEQFDEYWQTIYHFCEKYFDDEKYPFFLNGQYLRAVMLQIINTCIKQNLKYKDYKKVFKSYRKTENVNAALKNCNKNFLRNDSIFGKLLVFVFKHKLCFPFYIALKIYNKWHYN